MEKYKNIEIEIVYLYETIVGCNGSNELIEPGDNETPPTNPFGTFG